MNPHFAKLTTTERKLQVYVIVISFGVDNKSFIRFGIVRIFKKSALNQVLNDRVLFYRIKYSLLNLLLFCFRKVLIIVLIVRDKTEICLFTPSPLRPLS